VLCNVCDMHGCKIPMKLNNSTPMNLRLPDTQYSIH
jgi:hypothetical protein